MDKFHTGSDKTVSIFVLCRSRDRTYIVADVDDITSLLVVVAAQTGAHARTGRDAQCNWILLGQLNTDVDVTNPRSRVWDIAIRRHDLLLIRCDRLKVNTSNSEKTYSITFGDVSAISMSAI